MTDVMDQSAPGAPGSGAPATTAAGKHGPAPAPGRARQLGVRVALGGSVAMIAGMGVDAVQHALDETLIEREGLFTFSNLGHALLLGGAGVVVAGLVLAALGPALYDRPVTSPVQRFARYGTPVVLFALLAATAGWGSTSSLARGHAHDESGHGHDDTAQATGVGGAVAHAHGAAEDEPKAGDASSGVTGTGGHVHGDGPAVPLDRSTQQTFSEQMVISRETTMLYPTVAAAKAAGLRRVGNFAPGSGAHYMFASDSGDYRQRISAFTPAKPLMWLFSGSEDTSTVVGLMYFNLAKDPPEGYAGPNDHWHEHTGLCLKDNAGAVDLPLPIDQDATKAQCEAVGGRYMETTGWMVHVWSAPGWESPGGVFSHDNPLLVCTDGKTAAEAQLHVGCKGLG